MAKKGNLTGKQAAFVREYLVDHNATRAYLRAGYRCSEGAAKSNASRMMTNDDVASAIAAAAKVATDVANLTVQDTLTTLRQLVGYDVRKLFDAEGLPVPIQQIDDDTAAAIVGVEITKDGMKFKMADKVATLEKAMKYHALFTKDYEAQADALAQLVEYTQGALGSRIKPILLED